MADHYFWVYEVSRADHVVSTLTLRLIVSEDGSKSNTSEMHSFHMRVLFI